MTKEEAKDFLIGISYKLGNMAIEYLTEKDGEKMREAIKVLEYPTGQTLLDVTDENMENDARFQNMVRMWGRKEAIEKYKMFVLGQK